LIELIVERLLTETTPSCPDPFGLCRNLYAKQQMEAARL